MFNLFLLLLLSVGTTHEQIPKNEMACVIRQFRSNIKSSTVDMVVHAVKTGANDYDVDEPLILAFIETESNFRHISNKKSPYDTGMLQVLPYDHHIRKFLWIFEGKKAKRNPLKTLRAKPETAIIAGIYEMAWWDMTMSGSKRMKRLYRRLPVLLKQKLGKYKFIPFYNWGPNIHRGKTIAARYPYRILKNLESVRQYRIKCKIIIKNRRLTMSDKEPASESFAMISLTQKEEEFLFLLSQTGNISKEELSATIWQLGFMALLNETETMIDIVVAENSGTSEYSELKLLAETLKTFFNKFLT